jgi:hypothetical protein
MPVVHLNRSRLEPAVAATMLVLAACALSYCAAWNLFGAIASLLEHFWACMASVMLALLAWRARSRFKLFGATASLLEHLFGANASLLEHLNAQASSLHLRDAGFFLQSTDQSPDQIPERFPELRSVQRFLGVIELRSASQTVLLWPDQMDAQARRVFSIWLSGCAHHLGVTSAAADVETADNRQVDQQPSKPDPQL